MAAIAVAQSTKLREAKEKVHALTGKLHAVFEEAGPDRDFTRVNSLTGDTTAKIEAVSALNRELNDAHDEVKKQEEIEAIAAKVQQSWAEDNLPERQLAHPPSDGGRRETRSLGQLFVASPEYRQFKGQTRWPVTPILDIDVRAAVFREGAGWAPPQIRIDRVELSAQRPIAVVDMIPMLPTSSETIRYMRESTFTNNAVETAESTATTASDLIGEAALALTETTDEVEWLPVFIPVTLQQMEDVDGIQAYLEMRLSFMLRQRLDSQILVGNGSTPNLLGTNNVPSIQTQALGTDPVPDAIYKAMDLIRTLGFAEPSVVFSHPTDWQAVRLLRTADGVYIFGSPLDPGADRIWGVPVVKTTAATQNTMTLGDYANFSALYQKRGIRIDVSDSHSHYFTRGMLAIRADLRVAMVHFRAGAFATVTGV